MLSAMSLPRTGPEAFPPYHLLEQLREPLPDPVLDRGLRRAAERTRKLERLYHQTQAQSWDPREVLEQLIADNGGRIDLPPDRREAIGHVFTVILWGELAAWNVAADLARWLPDVDAKMAATGQVFDEARHFAVLRAYMERAGVELPPLNPYGRRVLTRILETPSALQKLFGMQLLVENLALAIFRRVAESNVEPVLTRLLGYIERDEARHVGLGVLYLPRLLARATPLERARNAVFGVELFVLTMCGGQLLDEHFQKLGINHRNLGLASWKLHQQVLRQMAEENGLKSGERIKGIWGLSQRQQLALVDFLHPDQPEEALSPGLRRARWLFDRTVRTAARFMS